MINLNLLIQELKEGNPYSLLEMGRKATTRKISRREVEFLFRLSYIRELNERIESIQNDKLYEYITTHIDKINSLYSKHFNRMVGMIKYNLADAYTRRLAGHCKKWLIEKHTSKCRRCKENGCSECDPTYSNEQIAHAFYALLTDQLEDNPVVNEAFSLESECQWYNHQLMMTYDMYAIECMLSLRFENYWTTRDIFVDNPRYTPISTYFSDKVYKWQVEHYLSLKFDESWEYEYLKKGC